MKTTRPRKVVLATLAILGLIARRGASAVVLVHLRHGLRADWGGSWSSDDIAIGSWTRFFRRT